MWFFLFSIFYLKPFLKYFDDYVIILLRLAKIGFFSGIPSKISVPSRSPFLNCRDRSLPPSLPPSLPVLHISNRPQWFGKQKDPKYKSLKITFFDKLFGNFNLFLDRVFIYLFIYLARERQIDLQMFWKKDRVLKWNKFLGVLRVYFEVLIFKENGMVVFSKVLILDLFEPCFIHRVTSFDKPV